MKPEIKIMKWRIFVTEDEECPYKMRFRFLREKDGWKWIQIIENYSTIERCRKAVDSWRAKGYETFMDNDLEES